MTVSDPLPNRKVETDTLPLRGRGCVPEQEAAKAPTHPGCSDESVVEDGIVSGNTTPIRTWPPRWKTESDTLPEIDLEQPDTIETTQPLRKRVEAQMRKQADAAPAAVQCCPRCEAKLIDPKGFGLCPQCGYCRSLEDTRGLDGLPAGAPSWVWGLLGLVVVALLGGALLWWRFAS
jgi:hypothetical protein